MKSGECKRNTLTVKGFRVFVKVEVVDEVNVDGSTIFETQFKEFQLLNTQ